MLGCATAPPREPGDFAERQQRLATLEHWQVEGKIGLRHDGRGNSASLTWRQHRDIYALRLSGPLGIGTVFINGDGRSVAVRNKDGEYTAASPEELILGMTGWHIPVTELRYWARGMPAPNLKIDGQQVVDGLLSSLEQGGWSIQYIDYTRVDNFWLPVKMIMSRPETQLTLIYKNWRLL